MEVYKKWERNAEPEMDFECAESHRATENTYNYYCGFAVNVVGELGIWSQVRWE